MTNSIDGISQPNSDIFYHYTDRLSAQKISLSGEIQPGQDGLVYVTDILYKIGWMATDRLGLSNKAEIAVIIPQENIPNEENISESGIIQEVPEIQGPNGFPLRRGGGHQWAISNKIDIPISPNSWIELEAP